MKSVGKLGECPIKSKQVAQNRIQDDFNKCQYIIYKELELSSETVSFSLDIWKAPNRKYIFGIIVYWCCGSPGSPSSDVPP
jgi:hypothetical protein